MHTHTHTHTHTRTKRSLTPKIIDLYILTNDIDLNFLFYNRPLFLFQLTTPTCPPAHCFPTAATSASYTTQPPPPTSGTGTLPSATEVLIQMLQQKTQDLSVKATVVDSKLAELQNQIQQSNQNLTSSIAQLQGDVSVNYTV